MSSDNDFPSSSFSSDDGGVKAIYQGAAIAANIYMRGSDQKKDDDDTYVAIGLGLQKF